MKHLAALLAIILIPIYLIASDQLQGKNKDNQETSAPKFIEKPTKPISAPSILSDLDKNHIEAIKNFKNGLSLEISNEIKKFRAEKEKLDEQKKNLYESLSKEAKKAIYNEKTMMRKLSHQGKKAMKDNLSQ